jgi:uncharacterized phage protein gp47/JayE
MPLSLIELQQPLTVTSVRTFLIGLLTAAGFPVASWQDESSLRVFLETQAALGAEQSQPVALLAKMAFLDTSVGDFLTALVKSNYDEERRLAIATTIPVRFVNSGAISHVAGASKIVVQASTGATFSNVAAGATLTANATTTVSVLAEVPGASGNIPGQELQLVTPFAGVRAFFDGALTSAGADEEGDPGLVERSRSKWATLRTEKIKAGILNLTRNAAPALVGVSIDDNNPRGPGTLDVYLAAANATAGGADVALVQTALDGALFGTGTAESAGLAIAAPTVVLNLAATAYVRGITDTAALTALTTAWRDFLLTVPVGGFDLSPGPNNVILAGQITDALTEVPGVEAVTIETPALDPNPVSAHTKVLEGTIDFTIVVLAG